jgi:hypothetical protein
MKRLRFTVLCMVSALLAVALPATAQAGAAASASASAPVVPLLTGIRAAHHGTFDRIVFDFYGGVPSSRQVSYVRTLVGDGSGLPVPIAGRAILQVRFEPARAHKNDATVTAPGRSAFPLPNVLTTVRSGDFEAVLTYGIGLAKRESYRIYTLSDPPRVVLDIAADFPTVQRPVWFFDQAAFVANDEPFFRSVRRPVVAGAPAHGLMDRLFAGPTAHERAAGLRLLASGASGYTGLSVSSGEVARLRLLGGCSSGGATVSIAGQIMPTLRQLPNVGWVKIYDPAGSTARPTGQVDSVPECLEP